MSYLSTGSWWAGAAERAVRAAAWAMLAALGVPQAAPVVGVDVVHVGWVSALSMAAGAGLLSVLGSVAAGPVGPDGSPSLVDDRPEVGR
jgi:hypothetical protein